MLLRLRSLPAALSATLLTLSAALSAQSDYSPAYTFTTLAGVPGEGGYADGPAASARFDNPQGIAVDATGNVYVSDTVNFRIRKITPAGIVSTLAGSGAFGSADGPASVAAFAWPTGLACTATGDLYVADTWNHTIRLLSPAGDTVTYAGTPAAAGYLDADRADARFDYPGGVAVARDGHLYIADTYNHTLRQLAPGSNVVTTLAGSGYADGGWVDATGANARFLVPFGLTVDDTGTLYVADSYNHAIRLVTPDGDVSTLAGHGDDPDAAEFGFTDGLGDTARFYEPRSIAVDAAHNLYVADTKNHLIRRITPAGLVTTLGGRPGEPGFQDGTGALARFNLPQSIAVDATGTVYVADTANHVIRKGVPTSGPPSRLVNLSTRAFCSTGSNVTIGGLVVSGSIPKRVLIRAVGPSLTDFSGGAIPASTVLADPFLEVHANKDGADALLVTNDDWSAAPNAADITATARTLGATPLAASDTKSSAVLTDLAPGVYTLLVKGNNATSGIVLLEIYAADTDDSPASSFVNLSTRADATAGDGVAIGGFVLTGNAPKRLLLRAVGPSLPVWTSNSITAAESLADPVIELHRGSATLATLDNWTDNAATVTATGARVGATALADTDTKSAALVTTLAPGAYTFVVKGQNSTTGIVLLEIYDAD